MTWITSVICGSFLSLFISSGRESYSVENFGLVFSVCKMNRLLCIYIGKDQVKEVTHSNGRWWALENLNFFVEPRPCYQGLRKFHLLKRWAVYIKKNSKVSSGSKHSLFVSSLLLAFVAHSIPAVHLHSVNELAGDGLQQIWTLSQCNFQFLRLTCLLSPKNKTFNQLKLIDCLNSCY